MATDAVDVIVLDARLRQSLSAVRSLGRRGLSVAAVDVTAAAPAFRSRWCRHSFVCPAGEGTNAYAKYVDQLAARLGAGVLISSHDGTIAALRRHRARLEQHLKIALAGEPALALAIDKAQTLAAAARLGVRVPPGIAVGVLGDLPSALREIGLPAVVKPTESWLQCGVEGMWIGPCLVTTPEEAYAAVARVTRYGGAALVQRLLTGRREAVSFLFAGGEVYARFAQWAKRTSPPLGGESVLRQSIPVPDDIGDQAERLVRELNLEGYTEVEFRRGDDGLPYLMEINSRLSASVDLAVRCGVDFPYLLHQWAAGTRIDRVTRYRVGRWMRHLQADVMTTIAAIEQHGRPGVDPPGKAVAGFALSFLRPMRYDYVDWQDPLPAVKALTAFSADFARRAVRVAVRRARAVFNSKRSSSWNTMP